MPRTCCYTHLVAQAAQILNLREGATADEVLRAVIAGQKQVTMAKVREIVMASLQRHEEHG